MLAFILDACDACDFPAMFRRGWLLVHCPLDVTAQQQENSEEQHRLPRPIPLRHLSASNTDRLSKPVGGNPRMRLRSY